MCFSIELALDKNRYENNILSHLTAASNKTSNTKR